MVVVDLEGNKVEGKYNPVFRYSNSRSSLPCIPRISAVLCILIHHGLQAEAQAGRSIPCYGTTHADYIYGEVPCVRNLTKREIEEAYEKNTGVLIADYFKNRDYEGSTGSSLCKNHGPSPGEKMLMRAVHNAVVLEEVAKMASRCELINPDVKPAPQELQDKHYYRKHGANAYYGQINNEGLTDKNNKIFRNAADKTAAFLLSVSNSSEFCRKMPKNCIC